MTQLTGANDLSALQRAMSNLSGAALSKFKRKVTYFVAVAIKGVIKPYPGPAHSPVIWPSEKARRYYFAMRREAGLSMKYKRGNDPMSQRVQQSWVVHSGNEDAVLGNRATYAPYVASEQYQTEQNAATGFITDAQAAEKVISSGVMDKIINANIKAMMDDVFRGLK